MKVVNIYVLGRYEYKTQVGNWTFYMTYKGAVLKQSGYIENAGSPTRVALYALMQALNRINMQCQVIVHSKANLGFLSMQTSKNKDLLIAIQRQIANAGHLFSYDTNFPEDEIKKWENEAIQRQSVKVNKQDDIEFEKHLEEQALASQDWRLMYSDLMGPSEGRWVPGSGGY